MFKNFFVVATRSVIMFLFPCHALLQMSKVGK